MERQSHQSNGGEAAPEGNSHGTDDPAGRSRIERAHEEASEHRQRDREERDRYDDAGINGEDAGSRVAFRRDVREQREQAAEQQAGQHTADSPVERKIRVSLYLARSEGRTVDDATARRLATELHGDEGSALDGLASSGAIQPDQLLQELAGCSVEGSWRVHWIDALTQYVLDWGERGPVPDWTDLAAEEPESGTIGRQPGTTDAADVERGVSAERAYHSVPRIYLADLASYNQGIRHGLWIDANQDVTELQADVEAMLASSPTVGAEEYAIHDFEGFAGFDVGEHEDLAVVSRVAKGIAELGEAFAAYLTWAGSSEEAAREFSLRYMGNYPTREAWAREMAERLDWNRQIQEQLDPALRQYVRIDYAAMVENMERTWHVVEGGDGVHVFVR